MKIKKQQKEIVKNNAIKKYYKTNSKECIIEMNLYNNSIKYIFKVLEY